MEVIIVPSKRLRSTDIGYFEDEPTQKQKEEEGDERGPHPGRLPRELEGRAGPEDCPGGKTVARRRLGAAQLQE